jgi:hypothetical protein
MTSAALYRWRGKHGAACYGNAIWTVTFTPDGATLYRKRRPEAWAVHPGAQPSYAEARRIIDEWHRLDAERALGPLDA